jgi:hypothetical protein
MTNKLPANSGRVMRLVLHSFGSPTNNETMKVFYDPMRPRKSPRYALTREQLRELARKNGVQRGRNTADTVTNLRKAGISLENVHVLAPAGEKTPTKQENE